MSAPGVAAEVFLATPQGASDSAPTAGVVTQGYGAGRALTMVITQGYGPTGAVVDTSALFLRTGRGNPAGYRTHQ